LERQQHGGTVAGVHHVKSSRHDVPTSEVGLAGTQLSSSIYGTVVVLYRHTINEHEEV
jgi:hypothetical protein